MAQFRKSYMQSAQTRRDGDEKKFSGRICFLKKLVNDTRDKKESKQEEDPL